VAWVENVLRIVVLYEQETVCDCNCWITGLRPHGVIDSCQSSSGRAAERAVTSLEAYDAASSLGQIRCTPYFSGLSDNSL